MDTFGSRNKQYLQETHVFEFGGPTMIISEVKTQARCACPSKRVWWNGELELLV